MQYDFTTLVDRSECGSEKWNNMRVLRPDLPQGIVPFSVADMEFKNAPEIVEGLKDYLDDHILGYTFPTSSYLQAVTTWMKLHHGWEISPEEVCTSPGVVPALFMLISALSQPGEGVILFSPVYYPFFHAVEDTGRVVKNCPLRYENGSYTIDFDLLETLAREESTKLLLFCSPHNPVGRVWTPQELKRVGDICCENDLLILSDEIHGDIIMPGHKHTPFSLAGDFAQRVAICTAPSKTFNLAAVQISNIIIPNETIREKFLRAKDQYRLMAPNALGLEACRLAYTLGEAWMKKMLSVVWENYQMASAFFRERLPSIRPIPLEGTYLLWLDCRALGLTTAQLEHLNVFHASLFLDEGYIFGQGGDGFERLNLACPTKVLAEGLARLEQAIKSPAPVC